MNVLDSSATCRVSHGATGSGIQSLGTMKLSSSRTCRGGGHAAAPRATRQAAPGAARGAAWGRGDAARLLALERLLHRLHRLRDKGEHLGLDLPVERRLIDQLDGRHHARARHVVGVRRRPLAASAVARAAPACGLALLCATLSRARGSLAARLGGGALVVQAAREVPRPPRELGQRLQPHQRPRRRAVAQRHVRRAAVAPLDGRRRAEEEVGAGASEAGVRLARGGAARRRVEVEHRPHAAPVQRVQQPLQLVEPSCGEALGLEAVPAAGKGGAAPAHAGSRALVPREASGAADEARTFPTPLPRSRGELPPSGASMIQ